MAVNSQSWKKFPVAARETPFKADDAIARIQEASRGAAETFAIPFLWRDSNGPLGNKNSYRLPVADVVNGKFTLIPRAVFTAAAILSGAHGGLEGVVGEGEKKQLRGVVTEIYSKLRNLYNDDRLVPPWERSDIPPNERKNRQITASVNHDVTRLPVTGPDHSWRGDSVRRRLWEWADGDLRRYRRGFLWWDNVYPDMKSSYKLPVADVVDGKLMVVPRAVDTLAAMFASAGGGVNIPDDAVVEVRAVIDKLQQRDDAVENVGDDAMTAAVVPVRPPRAWFQNPNFDGPTRLRVDEGGRVTGHLAEWNVCHFGIRDVCRMAPRSRTGYRYFMDGTVLTADGGEVEVGKLTVGTGHADLNLGYVPAADHYDNTGTVVAVVAAGEDQFGIWVSGALVSDASEAQVAALRRSPLSGDWRPTPYGLELVAALAVNSPGFPVVSLTASGEVGALVSAGMVLSEEEVASLGPVEVTDADRELVERLKKFEAQAALLDRRARSRRLDSVLNKFGGKPDGVF